MSLSDEQLMLLEQLTYMNDDVLRAAGLQEDFMLDADSVSKIVSKFTDKRLEQLRGTPDLASCGVAPDVIDEKGNSTHVSGAEWAAIITAIKEDPDLMSMKMTNMTHVKDDYAGYNMDAITFVSPKSKDDAVVCFRGTLNGEEWEDDSEYLFSIQTDCNQKALEYINQLPYENLTVVGHSKGANKAAYLYYMSAKVDYCLAMDCPGVPPELYTTSGNIVANKKGTIKCYSLESDFVNILLMPIPNAEYIYCKGSGVANFAENHCPNCFFTQEVDMNDITKIKINGIDVNGKQTEAMAKLHDFTCFLAMEMPYGERINQSKYLGNILNTVLKKCDFENNPEESKKLLRDCIMSDEKQFARTIAYFMKYCDLYDYKGKDFEKLLKEMDATFAFDKTAFTILKKSLTDGEPGSIVARKFAKKMNKALGIDKKAAERLYYEIEHEYLSMEDIEKKPEFSYEYFETRRYNYTIEAHKAITTAIKDFQELYYATTTLFITYSGEEWFAEVFADIAGDSLGKFYRQLPTLNNLCKISVQTAFENQWAVDDTYSIVMASYLRNLNLFRGKIKDLRDRLAHN